MRAKIIIAAFMAIFSIAPAFAAQNLVINGDFETGDFSGWDQFGDTGSSFVYHSSFLAGTLPVADGQFSAAFGPSIGLGGITQTIDTVPGKSYDVSFELANTDTAANNQFIFSFDDGFQLEGDTLDPFGFQTFTLPVTASGLSADVSFFFFNPAGFFLLDDVTATPLPEPASWSLLLTGFILVGATMRRPRLVPA